MYIDFCSFKMILLIKKKLTKRHPEESPMALYFQHGKGNLSAKFILIKLSALVFYNLDSAKKN